MHSAIIRNHVRLCRQIDCEQFRSSINQQLIAGCFGHEGLRQLHTKQFCTKTMETINSPTLKSVECASVTLCKAMGAPRSTFMCAVA